VLAVGRDARGDMTQRPRERHMIYEEGTKKSRVHPITVVSALPHAADGVLAGRIHIATTHQAAVLTILYLVHNGRCSGNLLPQAGDEIVRAMSRSRWFLRRRMAPRGAARAQVSRSAARRVPGGGGTAQVPVAGGREGGG
jgi:hypothetical protein